MPKATRKTAPKQMAASRAIFTPDEKQILRRHVVNLREGSYSTGGAYETSQQDVDRIFQELLPAELAAQQAKGRPLRLVFYAHGGLVSEEDGIRPVLARLPFYRANNLYPIFFCWETGLKETVTDIVMSLVTGTKDISAVTDAAIEKAAGAAGREVWSSIKRSADLASRPGGGARKVAEATRDFWNANAKKMEIHAIGHSAGSIFHAFFLPALLGLKTAASAPALSVASLHFLAPASTTALFEDKLIDLIGPGKSIPSHTVYTMNDDLEKADTAGPYKKSLLYLVSRAFETGKLPVPILGLENSLRDDSKLIRFYGLSRTAKGVAQVLFSKTAANAPLDSRTQSIHHGDFDDDVDTMNSVARRILRQPAGDIVPFSEDRGARAVRPARARGKSASR